MAGTKEGGMRAGQTNKELYGKDYYRRIGSLGGRNGHTGGFAANPELARIAGKKGGKKSTRAGILNGKGKNNKPKKYYYEPDEIVFHKLEERKRLREAIRSLEAEEGFYD